MAAQKKHTHTNTNTTKPPSVWKQVREKKSILGQTKRTKFLYKEVFRYKGSIKNSQKSTNKQKPANF